VEVLEFAEIAGGINSASVGGGRGVYASVDGDVPLALFARVTPDILGQADLDDDAGGHNSSVENCCDDAGVGAAALEQFVAITWNACGMGLGFIDDMVYQLGEVSRWDCVFIQEGPFAENVEYRVLDGGHLLFLSACRPHRRSVGVLLHRCWVAAVVGYGVVGSRVAFVDLIASAGQLRLISAHFPHSGYPDLEYEACMTAIEDLIEEGRAKHCINVVGVDANAVLGGSLPADSDAIVGSHGIGRRNERGHILCNWLHGVRLAAPATMIDHGGGQWTHVSWASGVTRQIDFLLVDAGRSDSVVDAGIFSCLDGKSDHRAAFLELHLISSGTVPRARQKILRGWRPNTMADYHAALDDNLAAGHTNVVDLTGKIVSSAVGCAERCPRTSRRKHNQEVQDLFDLRRSEEDPARRKQFTKDLWRALRRQRRQRQEQDYTELAQSGRGGRQLQRLTAKHFGDLRVAQVRDDDGTLRSGHF